jgi:hypothetical protein
VALTEEWLIYAKARLFDPTPTPEDLSQPIELPGAGIYDAEQMLVRLRRLEGQELVREYGEWLRDLPGMTAAMVRCSRERERAERRALCQYLRATDPQEAA